MDVTAQLRALFDAIVAEAERTPAFARRLRQALSSLAPADDTPSPPVAQQSAPAARRGGRRAPGALDPFAAYSAGEEHLRAQLGALDLDQLKDIVAEHGMDPSKLAMRWKTPNRLIDLIVQTVRDRSGKGDAFR